MNPALIAAIAAGLGSVIGVIGKVIVDVIKANHEPDQADLELKDELAREKEKNDAAIEAFTDFGKEVKASIEDLKKDINQKFDDVNQKIADQSARIEEYRSETREINKSELRHSITQIYFTHCKDKTLDLNTKNDLCSLFQAYETIGGNSFAHELYEEMMTWQVK